MKPVALLLPLIGLLSACALFFGEPEPELRFGMGYRAFDDPCRRVGETDITRPFLESSSDLVGCPIDFTGRPDFIRSLDATEVARTDEYVVYSVPIL